MEQTDSDSIQGLLLVTGIDLRGHGPGHLLQSVGERMGHRPDRVPWIPVTTLYMGFRTDFLSLF